jgi:hypothetical protein
LVERVGYAVAELKQDGSGQQRGKRANPPDGVRRASGRVALGNRSACPLPAPCNDN